MQFDINYATSKALTILIFNTEFHNSEVVKMIQTCKGLCKLGFGSVFHSVLKNKSYSSECFNMQINSYIPPEALRVPKIIIYCITSEEFIILRWRSAYKFVMNFLSTDRFRITDRFRVYAYTGYIEPSMKNYNQIYR